MDKAAIFPTQAVPHGAQQAQSIAQGGTNQVNRPRTAAAPAAGPAVPMMQQLGRWYQGLTPQKKMLLYLSLGALGGGALTGAAGGRRGGISPTLMGMLFGGAAGVGIPYALNMFNQYGKAKQKAYEDSDKKGLLGTQLGALLGTGTYAARGMGPGNLLKTLAGKGVGKTAPLNPLVQAVGRGLGSKPATRALPYMSRLGKGFMKLPGKARLAALPIGALLTYLGYRAVRPKTPQAPQFSLGGMFGGNSSPGAQ